MENCLETNEDLDLLEMPLLLRDTKVQYLLFV